MAEWQRRNDPDETEGRSLYRARADAVVRMQDSMARHTAKLLKDVDPPAWFQSKQSERFTENQAIWERMTEKAMSTCMSPRP